MEKAGPGIHFAAAGVAEALQVLFLAALTSSFLVLTSYFWIARLPKDGDAGLRGRYIGFGALMFMAVCIAALDAVGYSIPRAVQSPTVNQGTLYAGAIGGVILVCACVAAPYLLKSTHAGRRTHGLLALTSLAILLAASLVTYLIVDHYYLVATGRLTIR